MGVTASLNLLTGDAVSSINNFLYVFAGLYSLVILLYIVTSWLRLPYSIWMNRFQRFLYDVCEPYLRLFRRFLPSFGGLDLSPMLAVIVLLAVVRLITKFD